MKKVIVTTTIYPKSKAIEKFEELSDWEMIVIGDKKSIPYRIKNGRFVTFEEQENFDSKLSDLIGPNCIQRRSFGFILAYLEGADIVASVDDDNIPNDDWGEVFLKKPIEVRKIVPNNQLAFDPLSATNNKQYWHRGFPLSLLRNREYTETKTTVSFDIQANFWDGDPDIDAICRLEHGPYVKFDPKDFPFYSDRIGPFNSQNTMITRDVFKYWMMLPHVGRGDDILPSFYIQSLGFKVGYFKPTVTQERNPQNLMKNLKDEYDLYQNALPLIKDITKDPELFWNYLPERTAQAYKEYQKFFK